MGRIYMKLKGIAEKVFLDRYSLKDKVGNPIEKTPEEMWRRIADAVAKVEKPGQQKKWSAKFYDVLEDFKYVPGGRILAGAGTGYSVTYYNCFVVPSPQDSRHGILQTLGEMIEIMARGGGVGINLSTLRPRGARVEKVNGFSSGPCNWAEIFSLATKDIIQQGGTRRGALMLMLWDWHPDIEEFITVKQDLTRINGANLSVAVSDSFMEAVKKDEDWPLIFPDKNDPDYDRDWDGDIEGWKAKGKKIIVRKVVRARKIWNLISEAAWRSAEPGVVFLERYNKMHNNAYWNKIICVNPCGEEGLPGWGVCNLGSINLASFIKGYKVDKPGEFDFDLLRDTVQTAVRFQDNVVDMDPYIFPGIRKTQLEGERRIGLGTMGLGDTLIKLHIRYGCPESIEFIEKVYKLIAHEAYRSSSDNAIEKGSFKKFHPKKFIQSGFMQTMPQEIRDQIAKNGIRNSVILMQAPTGSTSLMVGTTSGIEPVYEFEFTRHDRLGEHTIRHYLYDEWYAKHEVEMKKKEISRPEYFVSANDLSPEDHIMVQATIQKYVDASISKTVNAPNSHTVEDVKRIYTMAYDQGLKGIAYMRDGSRQGVLERKLSPEEAATKKASMAPQMPMIKPRPMVVHGATYKIDTPVGRAYITVNTNGNNEPHEVFMTIGKAGTDVFAMAEGLGRMVSMYFRSTAHISPEDRIKNVIKELQGIGGGRTLGFGKERVRSLPDAVAKVLRMHFEYLNKQKQSQTSPNGNGNGNVDSAELVSELEQPALLEEDEQPIPLIKTQSQEMHFDICRECGQALLAREEGCAKCYGCGYAEC
ncbi:ribonucleoside-diphosphate reductase, adenosylcobalamin-dependent [Candidatus Roizmanbacteria bacterium CG10_big_fil_rev_8_21_14_0_10_39_12]|uniref:Vitamin B12-dependent ribonucleotide reductase n=1 Tax=Candidatus Roizmanbacteria bacterium CG10_big_fil_rev_8_21_14_0_10_39_12 TaxID=1974852 RepID=A0A2M8KNS7_9BACT|nr:MAG: ribonucleoside-diphosphate reductase, adenosylcobalamin-dependent [Candidatus Roizmanbacteria bacterium CG10_big_fil_rev_8_21_14_0_10_39_12]